jgi:hypothetical protein
METTENMYKDQKGKMGHQEHETNNWQQWQGSDNSKHNILLSVLLILCSTVSGKANATCKLLFHHHIIACVFGGQV